MSTPKGRGLTWLMVVAIAILIAQGGLLFVKTRELFDAEAERKKISEQITALQAVWENLQDAESGQRGFLLTGDDSYLASYTRAISAIDPQLGNAQRLFGDDAAARKTLATIETLKQRKLAELADGIRLRSTVGQHAAIAVLRSGVGRANMNELRSTLQGEIERANTRRGEIVRQISATVQSASYLLVGVSLAVLLIVGYAVRQLLRFFSANARLTQLLNEQATHDPLTGLPNRRMLLQWLEKMLAQAARAKTRAAVFFIDLDGFKKVNDERGHEVGDAVLRVAAARFGKIMRTADILARVGGDEFVAVLTNNPLKSDLRLVAQRLIDGLAESLADGVPANAVSASIGIAIYPEHGQGQEALLAAADHAMYQAKQAGKRQFFFAATEPAGTDAEALRKNS
jgi:diguanylate cyclase (GGDEF)-like protein